MIFAAQGLIGCAFKTAWAESLLAKSSNAYFNAISALHLWLSGPIIKWYATSDGKSDASRPRRQRDFARK